MTLTERLKRIIEKLDNNEIIHKCELRSVAEDAIDIIEIQMAEIKKKTVKVGDEGWQGAFPLV